VATRSRAGPPPTRTKAADGPDVVVGSGGTVGSIAA
jgi:hypothetical protein